MKNIVLYGILGADQQYRVAKYWMIHVDSCDNLINLIKFQAQEMKEFYPSIERVYAVSQRPGLKKRLRGILQEKHHRKLRCIPGYSRTRRNTYHLITKRRL